MVLQEGEEKVGVAAVDADVEERAFYVGDHFADHFVGALREGQREGGRICYNSRLLEF